MPPGSVRSPPAKIQGLAISWPGHIDDVDSVHHLIDAFLEVSDETLDVGVDTPSGVNDADYKVPFPFTGTNDKLTFKLGPPQLTAEDYKKATDAVASAGD